MPFRELSFFCLSHSGGKGTTLAAPSPPFFFPPFFRAGNSPCLQLLMSSLSAGYVEEMSNRTLAPELARRTV